EEAPDGHGGDLEVLPDLRAALPRAVKLDGLLKRERGRYAIRGGARAGGRPRLAQRDLGLVQRPPDPLPGASKVIRELEAGPTFLVELRRLAEVEGDRCTHEPLLLV